MMKRVGMLFLMCALIGVVQANLVPNGDFDGNADGWNFAASASWAKGYKAEHDVAFFGWSNLRSIYRNTGVVFQADTVYTMKAVVSAATENNLNQYEGAQLALISIDSGVWTEISGLDYYFPDEDRLDVMYNPGTFREVTMIFDTADNPAIVGTNIGVGVRALDTDAWGPNGWMYVQSISLVPEPATLVLLGLGACILRRRK